MAERKEKREGEHGTQLQCAVSESHTHWLWLVRCKELEPEEEGEKYGEQ